MATKPVPPRPVPRLYLATPDVDDPSSLQASLPGLQEYYQDARKAGKPIEVLAVAIRDTPEKARKAYADYAMPYPAGIESPGFDKLYAAARKTPTWVIVDKNGVVRQIGIGHMESLGGVVRGHHDHDFRTRQAHTPRAFTMNWYAKRRFQIRADS